ncbi:MAG: hypothetical protein KBA75_03675 [Alphaproteobacteria bacterium]|nr:hypothetical protein [Alphaproteobacteria bacterium]
MQRHDDKFCDMGQPRRVFAIGALGGDVMRLRHLHDYLLENVVPGDRVVYLGDYVNGRHGFAALNEMVLFRQMLMMRPGMEATDFVYLRGVLEEAWQRLTRIPYAQEPEKTLERLLDEGAEYYLSAYGADYKAGERAARSGLPALSRWAQQLREAQRRHAGHEQIMLLMRRAAFTRGTHKMLFVPCGFDPSRVLLHQGDALWSATSGFGRIVGPAQGYHRVIRGRDFAALGLHADNATLTLDNKEGTGPLLCAVLLPNGLTDQILQVPMLPEPLPEKKAGLAVSKAGVSSGVSGSL